ncbi:hypothetical protein FA95DRAFT_951920 [Auriscalpium vulgare]|uniref:Uncharacterized protein n=1 Tax=Auriscalpium vulgare TaxID=40419 RepID=A0ACB8RYK3_9AGAM|nr:hypothetical protein FA95DRAFT_951920 [Auriscalpium vulgare]
MWAWCKEVATEAKKELMKNLNATAGATGSILPFDVQVAIIDWVYRASQHTAIDRKTLLACSLVCKAWAPHAQRLLFRRLAHFDSSIPWERRSQCWRTISENPVLGTYVRSVKFFSHPDDTAAAINALLPFCPNISRLRVFVFQAEDREIPILLDNLSTLRLHPTHLELSGIDACFAPFLDRFPDLQCLDVTFGLYRQQATLRKTPRAVRIPWGSLAWPCVFSSTTDVSALRELTVLRVKWDDPSCLDDFTSTRAHVLENLSTLVLDGELPPQAVLDRCPRLETLIFEACPAVSPTLPATLRHVGYHAYERPGMPPLVVNATNIQHLVHALYAVPDLRLVTATRCLSNETLDMLESGCRRPGVDFATYGDAHVFEVSHRRLWCSPVR